MFQSTDDEQSCMFETFAINNENATTHNTGPTMHYEDKIPPGNSFQSDVHITVVRSVCVCIMLF